MKLTRKVLYNVATPMDISYPVKLQKMKKELLELMRKSGGIGLAAPQCGLSIRAFVMTKLDGESIAVFNPNILDQSEEKEAGIEGCLSFPGKSVLVERSKNIDVSYVDERGEIVWDSLYGRDARCFLHENDHLDGIVFTAYEKE